MTIAALQRLLDEELPHVRRPPAPRLHLPRWSAKRDDEPDMTDPDTITTDELATETPDSVGTWLASLQLGELLHWASTHTDTDVQALGEQARESVGQLHDRRAHDIELIKVEAELAKLEAQAARLRARQAELQPPAKPRGKAKTQRDYDPAEVRTWARANGHDAPDRGRIPAATLDAWRNRHGMEG